MEPCRLRLVIVSGLKEVVESQRRRNNAGLSWSYTLEEACSGFFAMQNLQRLLISYFAFWHPNCPMIHKPTFTVENSSPTLVAVMALVGACVSPVTGDRAAALSWLDIVEDRRSGPQASAMTRCRTIHRISQTLAFETVCTPYRRRIAASCCRHWKAQPLRSDEPADPGTLIALVRSEVSVRRLSRMGTCYRTSTIRILTPSGGNSR